MNKPSIDLVVIDDTLEALALRSALEWWGVSVNTYFIGKSQDIVDLFKTKTFSEYVCIAAHGDEIKDKWGIALPELGEEIAKQQPYNKVLFPSDLSKFIKFNNQHILNLACLSGSQEMSDVFLDSGAKSYIGPEKAPFGNTSLYFALNFYYWVFAKKLNVKEAYDKAMTLIDENGDKFTLFEK